MSSSILEWRETFLKALRRMEVSPCLAETSTMMPNQGEQGQTWVIGGGGETEEEPMSDLCSAKCKIPDA